MDKIVSLTDEQKAQIGPHVARWIAIGLSTQPADRPRSEAAIAKMYTNVKLEAPQVIWTGSPLGNATALADAQKVTDADKRKGLINSTLNQSGYGQHDAGWLSFYSFFREVVGLKTETEPLVPHMEIAQSAGWYLPYKGVCWVSERHNVLRRDTEGRLHNSSGPALQYPDGFEVYAWHGVTVPSSLILHPETYDEKRIFSNRNVEVRRAMLERIGWEKVLAFVGNPAPVEKNEDGELYKFKVQSDDVAFVRVTDPSTSRKYMLGVPPEMTRVRQAIAWTFAMDEKAWNPEVET